jgi:hypothetical protein
LFFIFMCKDDSLILQYYSMIATLFLNCHYPFIFIGKNIIQLIII